MNFRQSINWKIFWKYSIRCPLIVLLIGLIFGRPNPTWYWTIPLITLLFMLMMLLNAHSHYLTKKSKIKNNANEKTNF